MNRHALVVAYGYFGPRGADPPQLPHVVRTACRYLDYLLDGGAGWRITLLAAAKPGSEDETAVKAYADRGVDVRLNTSRADYEAAVRAFYRQAEDGETLFVVWLGHGQHTLQGTSHATSALVPSLDDDGMWSTHRQDVGKLHDYLRQQRAGQNSPLGEWFGVFDICRNHEPNRYPDIGGFPLSDGASDQAARRALVMFAASAGQKAVGVKFANLLIDELADRAADGQPTLARALLAGQAVQQAFARAAASKQTQRQTPDFFLIGPPGTGTAVVYRQVPDGSPHRMALWDVLDRLEGDYETATGQPLATAALRHALWLHGTRGLPRDGTLAELGDAVYFNTEDHVRFATEAVHPLHVLRDWLRACLRTGFAGWARDTADGLLAPFEEWWHEIPDDLRPPEPPAGPPVLVVDYAVATDRVAAAGAETGGAPGPFRVDAWLYQGTHGLKLPLGNLRIDFGEPVAAAFRAAIAAAEAALPRDKYVQVLEILVPRSLFGYAFDRITLGPEGHERNALPLGKARALVLRDRERTMGGPSGYALSRVFGRFMHEIGQGRSRRIHERVKWFRCGAATRDIPLQSWEGSRYIGAALAFAADAEQRAPDGVDQVLEGGAIFALWPRTLCPHDCAGGRDCPGRGYVRAMSRHLRGVASIDELPERVWLWRNGGGDPRRRPVWPRGAAPDRPREEVVLVLDRPGLRVPYDPRPSLGTPQRKGRQ
ncbi:hypothetical protein GCM10023205_57650 [Yinghuangia aomiensis]|uniref:Caspase domain-containing protein n=1 Tax=Yinghuangia aomiensis TaxID=676205 RepID=A0ABP9HXH3_9ACTN